MSSALNQRAAPPTETRNQGRGQPANETAAPSRAQGRAPPATQTPPPTLPHPQPGLMGVLLESPGNPLPAAMLVGGSTPSPTALPLRALAPRSQASVSTLGALGLAAGLIGVLLFVLWGAVSELRVGWFVR